MILPDNEERTVSGKKKFLIFALVAVIFTATAAGVFWHMGHYQMIGFRFYPKDLSYLDLRGQEVSISHYNKLCRRLEGCEILWDVPLQDSRYASDSTRLELPELTEDSVRLLAYFPELKTLDARGCTDYALLTGLKDTYPDLEVLYTVTIGGRDYPQDAEVLQIDGILAGEAELIRYLPELRQVVLETGRDPAQLVALTDACHKRGIPVLLTLVESTYDSGTTQLTLEKITDDQIQLLYFMPHLEQLMLQEPQAAPEKLLQLRRDLPGTEILWEKTLFGIPFSSDAVTLDLTTALSEAGALAVEKAKTAPVQGTRDPEPVMFAIDEDYPLPDLSADTADLIARAEAELAYFPQAEKVIFGGILLDNPLMADFRDAHRADYKVVWTVQCGNKMYLRTDATYLMPTKYHVYYFLDKDAENLKYCEDMVCIDLGHMAIHNVDWVTGMPQLTYLVLAHTQLQYIEPLRNCKNLKFLELDWSPIRDYSPLKDCTALEDLNLGETFANSDPIGEMTWLKNLWMVGCSSGAVYRMTQALPDTKVMASGSATVANGWRDLPNYYAMRDCLGMYYMSW